MESRLLLKTLFLYVERELYVSRKKLSIKLERDKVKYCVFCDIVKNSLKKYFFTYFLLNKKVKNYTSYYAYVKYDIIHEVCIFV